MQPALLETLGVEVGKHLSLPTSLPLRLVCKDWRDTVTLGVPRAELDLEPGSPTFEEEHASHARRATLYRRCPGLTSLTYHVSPRVCPSQFEAAMAELARRLPGLTHVELCFNNAAQQLETRHLRAITALAGLTSLSIQASFHPDACDFSVLDSLPALTELRVLASDAATGLTDGHVASLAALTRLAVLHFPGAPRAFTGVTLDALAALPRLERLAITATKAGPGAAVHYALAPGSLAALAAITRRGEAARPLDLELCVPDGGWVPALFGACAPVGLARLAVTVRDPVCGVQLAALAALPPAARAKLVGLEAECRGALESSDVIALGALTGLERLALSCKCMRQARERFDLSAWAPLRSLRSFSLLVSPGWRQPLQPATIAGLATAWPALEQLQLRLCVADNATHALDELRRFTKLRSLNLHWLGEPALTGRRRSSLGDSMAVLDLCGLPASLETLAATCISAVRIIVPSPEAVRHGARPPRLTSLSLDGNFGMSDALLARLASVLPGLRRLALVLAGRQPLTCDGLAAVGALSELTALLVADYRDAPLCLHQGCLAGLAGALRRLRSLKLSTHDIVHHELRPEVFAGFSKLRRLELVGCAEQAAAALAEQLPLCCMRPTPEWVEEKPVKPAAAAAAAEAMAVDAPAAQAVLVAA